LHVLVTVLSPAHQGPTIEAKRGKYVEHAILATQLSLAALPVIRGSSRSVAKVLRYIDISRSDFARVSTVLSVPRHFKQCPSTTSQRPMCLHEGDFGSISERRICD
jgi:hypothetical protein